LLVFGVDDGRGEQVASVIVEPSGSARFPHELSESGLPLDPVSDAALRDRAEQTIAVLEAADAWRGVRHGRRDRARA